MVTVAGEKRLWDGGLIGYTVWLALHGLAAASPGNEFDAADAAHAHHAENYARVEMAMAAWSIDARTGAATNAARVAFPAPPADVEWPPALSLSLFDALAGGDMLDSARIQGAPLIAAHGDPIAFEIGQLIIDI